MAIYTPRGLKIRLSRAMAFGYIGRLFPRVTAFQVLKTTEGFEAIPALCALLMAVVAVAADATLVTFALCSTVGKLVGGIGNMLGKTYRIPPLVKAATSVSYLNGFGLVTLLLTGLGYYVGEWVGVLYYFGGAVIAEVLLAILDTIVGRSIYKATGMRMTASERNFLASFMYHARRVGANPDLRLEDNESEPLKWMPSYLDLASRWPTIVARFDQTES